MFGKSKLETLAPKGEKEGKAVVGWGEATGGRTGGENPGAGHRACPETYML